MVIFPPQGTTSDTKANLTQPGSTTTPPPKPGNTPNPTASTGSAPVGVLLTSENYLAAISSAAGTPETTKEQSTQSKTAPPQYSEADVDAARKAAEKAGQDYYLHPNGGGKVALTAKVDPNAYVGPKAKVMDTARVRAGVCIEDEAEISGHPLLLKPARVSGKAKVSGETMMEGGSVSGNAQVSGSSFVGDDAVVRGDAKVGSVHIIGKATVEGKAELTGDVLVKGEAYIGGTAHVNGPMGRESGTRSDPQTIRIDGKARLTGTVIVAGCGTHIGGKAEFDSGVIKNGEHLGKK